MIKKDKAINTDGFALLLIASCLNIHIFLFPVLLSLASSTVLNLNDIFRLILF